MILLVHMLFGAAIGYQINNVPLAIVSAFLSHYFLDLFPHIEYLKSIEESIEKIQSGQWKRFVPDMTKIAIDFLLGITAVAFLSNQPIVYLCAIMAIIPDGLTVVTLLFPNKILLWHHKIHTQKVHFLKYKKTKALNELSVRPSAQNIILSALVSIPFRILTQIIALAASIILLKL